jgi:hypothetical protein
MTKEEANKILGKIKDFKENPKDFTVLENYNGIEYQWWKSGWDQALINLKYIILNNSDLDYKESIYE